ncbi:MAG: DUF2313 domain-containing protein [Lachnospiraceae bacterium]|nr:DUF2313 domain-containing protein [Lachnospiraceae bacterium]
MDKEKTFDLENFPTSESAKRMMSYVTADFYEKSYIGKWIYQVMGLEYDEARKLVEELPYQAFLETATWGLMYHEIKWGLPVRENLSYEERRKIIKQKRDYRAPMTPYRMETNLSDLCGCKVVVNDIHDPGEDGFIPEHPNVFRVTLETGSNPVNLTDVLQKLNKIKQSHTTFIIRVIAVTQIDISVKPEGYKVEHRICGTFPKVSTGWKKETGDIDIDVVMDSTKMVTPLSGESGETGNYPKISTGMKQVTNSLAQGITTENFRVTYPLCGSEFKI